MQIKNRLFTKQNMMWCLLVAVCIGTLYTRSIAALLFVIIMLNAYINMKTVAGSVNKGLSLLINYLPFYSFIRVTFIYLGLSQVSGLLNYFRDFIIIVMLALYLIRNHMIICTRKMDQAWGIFIVNWIVGLFVSTANGYPLLGVSGLHLSMIPMLLFYVIISADERIDYEALIKQFLMISLAVAIVGILAYENRPPVYCSLFSLSGNGIAASDYVRFVSVFLTPNVCGCFFAIAYTVALVCFVYKKRIEYLALAIVMFVCLIFTLSRGSWAFALITTAVLLCFIKPKVGIPFLTLGCVGIAIVILGDSNLLPEGFMTKIIQDRFLSMFDRSNSSSYGRISVAFEYISQILKNPLGFGLGVSSTAQISYGVLSGVDVTDGFYFKSIIETGFVGVIYIVAFVIWLLKRNINAYLNGKSFIATVSLLISIGFLVQSFGSNTFDFVCTSIFVWLFLGIAAHEYGTDATILVEERE